MGSKNRIAKPKFTFPNTMLQTILNALMNKTLEILKQKTNQFKSSGRKRESALFEKNLKRFFGSDWFRIFKTKFQYRNKRHIAKLKGIELYVKFDNANIINLLQEIKGEMILIDRYGGIKEFYNGLKEALKNKKTT